MKKPASTSRNFVADTQAEALAWLQKGGVQRDMEMECLRSLFGYSLSRHFDYLTECEMLSVVAKFHADSTKKAQARLEEWISEAIDVGDYARCRAICDVYWTLWFADNEERKAAA